MERGGGLRTRGTWDVRLADPMQCNTVKGIQSVKRMKDSAEQKINRRERAGGNKIFKKKKLNKIKEEDIPDSDHFCGLAHPTPLEVFGGQSAGSNKACEKLRFVQLIASVAAQNFSSSVSHFPTFVRFQIVLIPVVLTQVV